MMRIFLPKRFIRKIIAPFAAIVFGGAAILAPAGCAPRSAKSLVIMQNPETMEFVDCKLDTWATPASYEKNTRCVEDLKKKGYIVWGER